MITAFLIGCVLGVGYAWAARKHHIFALAASGALSKKIFIVSTMVRIVCSIGIALLVMQTTGQATGIALSGLVGGYCAAMFWAYRR